VDERNGALRAENLLLRSECAQLRSENDALKDGRAVTVITRKLDKLRDRVERARG
jgi:hypothetical protein